ncbi:hypothetical protein [Rufibacter latericius]|uniref:Uncharacterized protein n=1 Tax=Rufibacter latericius TaxID=2487040 RepID=A0A3M9M914_9BACT|nr:hypothetical protein [Rufibacter latericius]RNI22049.1 hypothetical protein EFB08_23235 [Rufibacter latericius]
MTIMRGGIDKVIAQLRLQHQQEQKGIDKLKQEFLANADSTEEEKQAHVDNLAEKKKLPDEKLRLAEMAAKVAARDEEALK